MWTREQLAQEVNRLDYRRHMLVDADNPILIQKAWRDWFYGESRWKAGYGGQAYFFREHSEDALTWNVFRTLQLAGPGGLAAIAEAMHLKPIRTILFWGCDVEAHSDAQQQVNCLIRAFDGRWGGTMTEPDLVFITDEEAAFVECKLNQNGNQSPWKAQKTVKSDGAAKRFLTYTADCGFPELDAVTEWRDVYQMIRQYVYAKSLGLLLGLKPAVIPLVNETHIKSWQQYYEPLRQSCLAVYRPFATWQGIRAAVVERNQAISNAPDITRVIDNALAASAKGVRK